MAARVYFHRICATWAFLTYSLTAAVQHSGQAQSNEFDYVIVGGGTAGLVVAARLSEDPNVSVAVLEAGNFEEYNPLVTNISALGLGTKSPELNWAYRSAPQTYVANKSITWNAGKGMGGSSLINGMTYMRPSSAQINLWPSLGLDLDWDILFNYSIKSEHFEPPPANFTALGACYNASYEGADGPLATTISPFLQAGDLHDILNETFQSFNIPPRCDFNGGDLLGFGVEMVTQDAQAKVRESSARAYYYPNANRSNLVVMVNTTATRLLWTDNSTSSGAAIASAVEAINQAGQTLTFNATREVILSAGAIRSPAILENSGIGNPSFLTPLSIPVIVPLPSVGENFQDQTVMSISGVGLQTFPGFPTFVAHLSLQDIFGNATDTVFETAMSQIPAYAATIASQNGGASNASVQEHLLATQLTLLKDTNTPMLEIAPLSISTLFGAVFWPLQPLSRGSVHINSTNLTAIPVINANFLQSPFDQTAAVATAKWVRTFLLSPQLSSLVNATSLSASEVIVPLDASDDAWLEWVRTNSTLAPNYHHLGTCAMLPREMGGVVDNEFRVYGTGNVRVVDLSVVPLQISGHSTAPLYGIAEWASVKIKEGPGIGG